MLSKEETARFQEERGSGRRPLRQGEPVGAAASERAAHGRARPGLLQPQTLRAGLRSQTRHARCARTRLRLLFSRTAVGVRPCAELHEVSLQQPARVAGAHPPLRARAGIGGCPQHRQARREGGRPALPQRRGQFSDHVVEALRRFDKITLGPGEKRTVTFTLTPHDLKVLDQNMKWVVEPGEFEVMVGEQKKTFTVY